MALHVYRNSYGLAYQRNQHLDIFRKGWAFLFPARYIDHKNDSQSCKTHYYHK